MKTTARLAGIGGFTLAATALFAGAAVAAPNHHSPAGNAVFVQTDNPAGNAVVAYHRAANGTLTRSGTYGTGGDGGVLDGSVVDHLASQGSLVADSAHGLLYAVNAGSNTLTVFTVDGDRLHRAQVISSGGAFPVSVTTNGHAVYVLNARGGGSVQGFLRLGDRLVKVPAWHRSLGLDPTAAPEFTHSPGQVAFTPDGGHLVVTTKGNGSNIDVFGVDLLGGLSARPAVTNDPSTPFAVTFDARDHLVVGESGANSVATFTVHRDGTLSLVDRVATGQAATCWVESSGSHVYASNAGSNNLTGLRDNGSGALTNLGNTATDGGTVDAAASSDGRFLYSQTGANGIVDEFAVHSNGSLTKIGSVTVPNSAGGEGIVAS
ncbi:MAG TPA: beta-propeller fold lactonase family protein [Pseudonocardiaceae bacterium]|nr:beta-propeller fold lactonase family protein [Pseudonocardiaceae bacterium]